MVKNLRQGDGLSLNILKKRISKKAKTILIPIDGSENSFRVLRYAIRRAEGYSDKLVGIYVIPEMPQDKNIKEKFKTEGQKILNKAKKQCASYNIEFSSKIIQGNPGGKIVEFANKNKIDEIIIGHSNQKPNSYMGSTVNYVVNKSKLPVTIIK